MNWNARIVTSASNALITLAVSCVVIVAFVAGAGRVLDVTAAARLVFYVVQYSVIMIGFSLASSVLFLRYRDLNQVWDLAAQAGFFVAPVIYPLSIIPEPFHVYLYLWPPTPIIQFSRAVLIDGTVPSLRAHAFPAVESAVILGVGILVFRRFGPQVAEYL